MEKSIQVFVLTRRKYIDFWFTFRFYRVDPVKSLPKKGAGFEMSPCGRVFHPDKRGVLDENLPSILKRIGVDPSQFIECVADFLIGQDLM